MQTIRSITVICLLAIPLVGLSQSDMSHQVISIVDKIAEVGSIGFDHDTQYSRFLQLNEIATMEDLVTLTDDDSPAVRGYAFWALAKRNYPDLKTIFLAHLDDRTTVLQRNGCMVGKESVISFMKQVVTPYMYDYDCMKLDDVTRDLVR